MINADKSSELSQIASSVDYEGKMLLDKENNKSQQAGTLEGFSCYIMNIKSLVGIGIFILLHCVKSVGYIGFGLFYGTLSLFFVMFIVSMMHVANQVGYYGNR